MSEIACPKCLGAMQCPPELIGKWVACPLCQHHFVLPRPPYRPNVAVAPYAQAPPGQKQFLAPSDYTQLAQAYDNRRWVNGIKVPILISAIFNITWSTALLLTCYGAVFAFPLLMLCIFEFIYFGTADTQSSPSVINNGRVLGILEIVVGSLSCNIGVLVCGILALTNANQAEQQLASSPSYR